MKSFFVCVLFDVGSGGY